MDIDGDGLQDIVTGKRFWSHDRTGDPDRNSPGVLYWFKLARNGSGDGLPDIVVGSTKGTFVHLPQKTSVPALNRIK